MTRYLEISESLRKKGLKNVFLFIDHQSCTANLVPSMLGAREGSDHHDLCIGTDFGLVSLAQKISKGSQKAALWR